MGTGRSQQPRNTTTTERLAAWMEWIEPEEPLPHRGPFTRWPRIADAVLVVLVFATSVVFVTASALEEDEGFGIDAIGERPVGAVVLLAVAAGALYWRRTQATTVAVAVLAVMIAWALAGYGDGHDLALVVISYSVGRGVGDARSSLLAVAAIAVVSLLGTIIDADQRVDVAPSLIISALPWYVGRRVRTRGAYVALLRERATHLEAEQHAEARRAVADERSRIARELHDVVAHQVSMMTVQAGAAKTVARVDLDAAVEAMGDVERAGRQALGELRHLLGVLHHETDGRDDLGPQRGLRDVPALITELRQTGATVDATLPHPISELSAATDLAAYRIVQESLTNVVKHAGTTPHVSVTVALGDGGLEIEVVNTTKVEESPLPDSGFGIAGMAERAALLGGTLIAEPVPPDRFRVRCRLPLSPVST